MMQETKFINEHGHEDNLKEIFIQKVGERQQDLTNRMNNRLFELEEKGHVLVGQYNLSERRMKQKSKKAIKKLNKRKAREAAL